MVNEPSVFVSLRFYCISFVLKSSVYFSLVDHEKALVGCLAFQLVPLHKIIVHNITACLSELANTNMSWYG